MLQVTSGSRLLGDLDGLGVAQIDPLLRAFMAKHHEALTKTYANPFYLVLYRNGLPMHEVVLYVDENLMVHATQDLDPREQYHLWIGCTTDLSMLTEQGIVDLLADGETTKQVIRVVDSTYDVDSINILDDGAISLPRWNVVKTTLKETEKRYNNKIESNTLTVGQFVVTARNDGR
tara:strand:- start:832 stop:1359 length:528 start_codon:yes stop_codon:yes gene_type:complete